MNDSYWFHKKWGINDSNKKSLKDEIDSLKIRIQILENENKEINFYLSQILKSIDAVDNRVDIVFNQLKGEN